MKINSLITVTAVLLLTGSAFAQSSGNFSASAITATCAIGPGGKITQGSTTTFLASNISTSNGSGVTLKITPALVTGLFTQTKIDTSVETASADVGIKVCVTVDGSGAGVLPKSCVVYDQRFQQLSSTLFSQIAACNTVVCTTSADCSTAGLNGATCINPTGLTGGGVCVVPTAATCTTTADCATGQTCLNGICNQVAGVANLACNMDLILSTLSAHSFDFVVPGSVLTGGKMHKVVATWTVAGNDTTANSAAEACVGPGIVDITQMKVFNNSGALLTF